MKFKDKHGLIYYTVKKNNKYYLLIQLRNSVTKQYEYEIEVEGRQNVLTYIKNNSLRRVINEVGK